MANFNGFVQIVGWKLRNLTDVVAFEPDLFFSSRIESTARNVGASVLIASDFAEFLRMAELDAPRIVLLDLDYAKGKLRDFESFARSGNCETVGYYSHVNSAVAEEAKRVGVGTILTRRSFVEKIRELLDKSVGH